MSRLNIFEQGGIILFGLTYISVMFALLRGTINGFHDEIPSLGVTYLLLLLIMLTLFIESIGVVFQLWEHA
jgi:hypothetical protein